MIFFTLAKPPKVDPKGGVKNFSLKNVLDENQIIHVKLDSLGIKADTEKAMWNDVRCYTLDQDGDIVEKTDELPSQLDRASLSHEVKTRNQYCALSVDKGSPDRLGFFIGDIHAAVEKFGEKIPSTEIKTARDYEKPPAREGVNAPYHHQPLLKGKAVITPLYDSQLSRHDDYSQGSYSGSFQCTLTCLTNSHFGNFQDSIYKFPELMRELNSKYNNSIKKEKNVVVPNFIDTEKGMRALISGSSIMGMLRNNVASLVSAPMQRVAEKTLSYRPNMVVPEENPRPDIKPFLGVISCGSTANNKRVSLYLFGRNTVKFGNAGKYSSEKDYQYFGGIDSDGELTCHFKKLDPDNDQPVYKTARFSPPKYPEAILPISDDLVEQFKKTTQHLTDSKYGHISSQHPHSAEFREGLLSKNIEANRNIDTWFRDRKKELLIYVEARLGKNNKPVEIVSFGNNYRYRWRYKDSVRYLDSSKSVSKLRPELVLSEEEAFYFWNAQEEQKTRHELPKKLNLARSLFGDVYQRDELLPGNTPKSSGTFDRFAGKVSVNHAIELNDGSKASVFEQNTLYAMPRPGSPKANAEHNLKQNEELFGISSWGFTGNDNDSELAGRKIYRHQRNPEDYGSDRALAANLPREHAPLLQYVSPENLQYKTTIRFKNLTQVELGVLALSVQPDLILNDSIIGLLQGDVKAYLERMKEQKELAIKQVSEAQNSAIIFANKLGYGRPLGMGSINLNIDKQNLFNVKDSQEAPFNSELKNLFPIENTEETLAEAISVALSELLNCSSLDTGNSDTEGQEILHSWLALRNFKYAEGRLLYPGMRHSGNSEGILQYHASIRSAQLNQRRFNSDDDKEGYLSGENRGLLKPILKLKEARTGK